MTCLTFVSSLCVQSGIYDYPDPFWSDVSNGAKDLIDHLLVLKPEKR